jgi:hypothetical protein
VLRWTDEARELWSRTEDVIGLDEKATRLDEIGARLLAVFTVTSEKTEIDVETVRGVCLLEVPAKSPRALQAVAG